MSVPGTVAPGVTAADDALLAAVAGGLSAQPFAARVDVLGLRISRPVARALEQQLLRARTLGGLASEDAIAGPRCDVPHAEARLRVLRDELNAVLGND